MKKRKIILPIISLLTAIFAFLPSFNALALAGPWGPERETYTWEQPATHAVFNSIVNNPGLGDERNFVRIRKVGDAKFGDEVALEAGQKYEVYIYYHNNATDKAAAGETPIGQTAIGIADNVRMSANFPAKIQKGEKLAVNAIISARFSDLVAEDVPRTVWDGAYVAASELLYLRYVPGTATIHNGGELNGANIGPDYLFSDEGAVLGYNKWSGILPGCNMYAGYVTYQFQADKPDFTMSKKIKTADGKLVDSVTVNAGAIVEFVVSYQNIGTMVQENVRVRDVLPAGFEYIKGSAVLKNNSNPTGGKVNDDLVKEGGMNIGNYAGGDGYAEISYKAKVVTDTCEAVVRNRVSVITADGSKDDIAEVKVAGTCTPPELPHTGPTEVVLLIVAVMGITVGGTYWYRSRKALRKTIGVVQGEGSL
jgi:uncharacterized repeat protein (TIGR01451 family)